MSTTAPKAKETQISITGLPPELLEQIEELAKTERRSRSSMICILLEERISARPQSPAPAAQAA